MDDNLSPIYRPDHFWPLAMGTTVMLLGTGGPAGQNPFFHIDYMEQAAGLNLHGVTMLWTHSAAAPAGYELPAGATSGALAANGGQTVVTPGIFNLARGELFQFRFALRPVVWAAGANVAADIDLQVSLPAGVNRWTLLGARGRLNMMSQVGMPSDTAEGPAQAANIAASPLQPVGVPWDGNHFTEMFCYEQIGPSFTIINNGATASAAGDAIGIYIWGYDYKLNQCEPDASWSMRRVPGGVKMLAPAQFVTIPISGRGRGG